LQSGAQNEIFSIEMLHETNECEKLIIMVGPVSSVGCLNAGRVYSSSGKIRIGCISGLGKIRVGYISILQVLV